MELCSPESDFYSVRWRFDFLNRPTKTGVWNSDPDEKNISEKACFQNKEGLIRAAIEGENRRTYEVKTLVECDGHDFINFEWLAEFRMNAGGFGKRFSRHVGLSLITREFEYQAYIEGGRVIQLPRAEFDKNFHYATFGR